MHYAFVGYDRPNGLARRMAGSIMVIEATSQQEAEELYAKDPFMVNRLFASVTIKRWQLGINNTQR